MAGATNSWYPDPGVKTSACACAGWCCCSVATKAPPAAEYPNNAQKRDETDDGETATGRAEETRFCHSCLAKLRAILASTTFPWKTRATTKPVACAETNPGPLGFCLKINLPRAVMAARNRLLMRTCMARMFCPHRVAIHLDLPSASSRSWDSMPIDLTAALLTSPATASSSLPWSRQQPSSSHHDLCMHAINPVHESLLAKIDWINSNRDVHCQSGER
jgi:hypothetical protein